jgi:hypothetical protein
MVSLYDLGLLLLAAPLAIAAPSRPSPKNAPLLQARCDNTLRFTHFDLYSDTGCQNLLVHDLTAGWTPCSESQTPELSNGATFGSAVWTGGNNAQRFAACQFGHSCSDDLNEIIQNAGVCSGGGGRRFDKIQIIP